MTYSDYLHRKLSRVPATGIPHSAYVPHDCLFPHQRALVSWACKRGRAAIFADTGLGKSRMQLAWAEAVRMHTGRSVLILAPLAVAPQTVAEGAEIGVTVNHCRDGSDHDPAEGAQIVITNYDRLHRFDPAQFGAVVLDESSCIKHHDAKTLRTLLEAFRSTPFCPLQLDVIRRGVMLWTNPSDIVLSPFMGIGSEGYVALEMGRRFCGVELKTSYYAQAVANLAAAVSKTEDLFHA